MAITIVAKTVSFAYCTSRNWCARQTYQCSVCPNWEPYMSDTHTRDTHLSYKVFTCAMTH